MEKVFVVHLSHAIAAAQKAGDLTIYMVAKKSGASFNTVKKYAAGDIKTPYLTGEVIQLCEFLGLDWRDPAVVQEMISEGSESSGQLKTLLAASL